MSVGATNYHDRLYHDLFTNYTQETAPLRHDGQPLIVNVSLQLVSIIGLVQHTLTATFHHTHTPHLQALFSIIALIIVLMFFFIQSERHEEVSASWLVQLVSN